MPMLNRSLPFSTRTITFLIVVVVFFAQSMVSLQAQIVPLWMRYPALSPDGSTIVFSYRGDLYRVPSQGGQAIPLTVHEGHETNPVWSHDGKMIAFASDRYGNYDVFVMPASGGEAKRLTAHSVNDIPYDFTADNSAVLFGSGRHTVASNVRFPSGRFQQLYKVDVRGGKSILLSAVGMEWAKINTKGTAIVYQDRKAEDPWRKHHVSSVARDMWQWDISTNTYTKLSAFEGENREPVIASDDQRVFFLAENKGAQNIYVKPLSGGTPKQLTTFANHPVRHLTRSNDNTLCFSWNGEIYTMKEGAAPSKVAITIAGDVRSGTERTISIAEGISEAVLAPNGKEVAYVVRGEVFVASIDGQMTKRITNTAYQERMVA